MHDAPVVRFLPKLGREISHGLFFSFELIPGCDVSFLAKPEKRIVPLGSYMTGETRCHAVERR